MAHGKRLTLIASSEPASSDQLCGEGWTVFIDPTSRLSLQILAALNEPSLDTARVILDRVMSADTFLELLAALPREFGGDVLHIGEHGRGFLSAAGRGGDRVFYALEPDDIHFYLDLHHLTSSNAALLLEKTA